MKKVYVCDKVVTLTDEEVKAMNAEVERRLREDEPMCSAVRHYDNEGNRCNQMANGEREDGCVCDEIITHTVYGNNPKIDAVWKARVAAQRRKKCKCVNSRYYTCERCLTLEDWKEDWHEETQAISWDIN